MIALYIVKQKNSENYLNEKAIKIKWEHAFKDYASTYNIEMLKSFNPELTS